MLSMPLTAKIFSLFLASVLASFGIVYNDVSMLMSASLISPLMTIIDDVSINLVKLNIQAIFFNLAALFAMVIIAFIIGLRVPKTQKDDPTLIAYAFIGLLLGIYTAYIQGHPSTPDTTMQLVGVSLGIIALSPIVKIGTILGQNGDADPTEIKKNVQIVLANVISYLVGATVTRVLPRVTRDLFRVTQLV